MKKADEKALKHCRREIQLAHNRMVKITDKKWTARRLEIFTHHITIPASHTEIIIKDVTKCTAEALELLNNALEE